MYKVGDENPRRSEELEKTECFGFGWILTRVPALWAGDSAY